VAFIIVGICCGILLTGYELSFSSDRFIEWYVKIRTRPRSMKRKVTITNPEKEVVFFTRRLNPIIDLEYDDDVRNKLSKVTVKDVVINKENKLKKLTLGSEMKILFKGKPFGELIIREY
jgi:hypothetical protein